jgi:hypothetical protein
MDFLKMLKCCLNPKVIIGVLAVLAIFYFFAPQLLRYSGLLLALICPLSMVLMMSMMNNKKDDSHDKSDTDNQNNQNQKV